MRPIVSYLARALSNSSNSECQSCSGEKNALDPHEKIRTKPS